MKQQEYQSGSYITVIFEGTPEETDKAVKQYFNRYPAYGYSTKINGVETLPDGTERVKVNRYANCD